MAGKCMFRVTMYRQRVKGKSEYDFQYACIIRDFDKNVTVDGTDENPMVAFTKANIRLGALGGSLGEILTSGDPSTWDQ